MRVPPVVKVICVTVVAGAAMALPSAQAQADGGPVKPTPTPIPSPAVPSFTPKDAQLAKLAIQADRLAGGGSAAETVVLADLVETELAATAKVDHS